MGLKITSSKVEKKKKKKSAHSSSLLEATLPTTSIRHPNLTVCSQGVRKIRSEVEKLPTTKAKTTTGKLAEFARI